MKYCIHGTSFLGEHFLSYNVRFFTERQMRKLSISYFDYFHYFLLQAGRIRAVGIVGIERKLEEKRKETDKNISEVNTTEVSRSTTCLNHLHSFTFSFRGNWDYLLFLLWSLNWLRVYNLQLFTLFNWLFTICKDTSFKQFLSRRLFFETNGVYL